MSVLSAHHGAVAGAMAGTTAGSANAEDAVPDLSAIPRQYDPANVFRNECLVSDADLRVDVAKHFARFVAGDEEVSVKTATLGTRKSMTISRGSRDRTAGSYEQLTHNHEVTLAVGESYEENVEGGVHVKAAFSAEAMVGGTYTNTIAAGACLRLAAWTDFLAWGGWVEVDQIRTEMSLLMIRSHMKYAHSAGARVTFASRLIDDFQVRTGSFGSLNLVGATYEEMGDPAGGVVNES